MCAEMVDFEDIEGLRSRAGEKKLLPLVPNRKDENPCPYKLDDILWLQPLFL
jgi:hypothetical protein